MISISGIYYIMSKKTLALSLLLNANAYMRF